MAPDGRLPVEILGRRCQTIIHVKRFVPTKSIPNPGTKVSLVFLPLCLSLKPNSPLSIVFFTQKNIHHVCVNERFCFLRTRKQKAQGSRSVYHSSSSPLDRWTGLCQLSLIGSNIGTCTIDSPNLTHSMRRNCPSLRGGHSTRT